MTSDARNGQLPTTGDLDPESFRELAKVVVDLMADYLRDVEEYPVLPGVQPGELHAKLDGPAPEDPEPLESILEDYKRLIEPNVTHWQHPGFLAYFASTGSAPGILGEMLMATLTANAMLWRTSPVATELEQVVVDWLRQGFGLPVDFDGLLTDTASTSSLIALAAARETTRPGATRDGLAARLDCGRPLWDSTKAIGRITKTAGVDLFFIDSILPATGIAEDRLKSDPSVPFLYVAALDALGIPSVSFRAPAEGPAGRRAVRLDELGHGDALDLGQDEGGGRGASRPVAAA